MASAPIHASLAPMKKFPFSEAIRHGYRFAFSGFFDLLRLLWLPALLTAAVSYFTSDQMGVLAQGLRTHDFSRLSMPWPLLLLLVLGGFLCGNMELTGAYRLALGQIEARGRFFYLPLFERALWRVVGAFLALMLSIGGLIISYVLAVLVIGFLFNLGFHATGMSDAGIKAVTEWDTALAISLGYCGLIFCLVRFGFLLFPATIAEEKIGLFRAWTLSNGNFWRMFAASLAGVLPLLGTEVLLVIWLGIFKMPPAGATAEQIRAMQAAAEATADAKIHDQWFIYYPVLVLGMLLTYGVLAGIQSFAYRALADGDERPIS